MRALTVSQPWASLIGPEKPFENRRWRTPYRGLVFIHAGQGQQYMTHDAMRRQQLPIGAVVSVAYLAAIYNLDELRRVAPDSMFNAVRLTAREIIAHKHAEGPELWAMLNVRRLVRPIPCRGAQGLWVPSAQLIYDVRVQLGSLEWPTPREAAPPSPKGTDRC